MFNKTRNILFSTLLVSVTACAGSGARYIPVVDGPVTEKFHTDLDSCRAVSASLQFDNGDVRTEAAAGALFGAVAGVLEDGTEGAIVGSALGAIAGGADRAWDVREERKAIVMKCLTNRGHNVVG